MGRKSDRKATEEDGGKKKNRKERSTGIAQLMAAVQGCPPVSELHFEWVVGNGIGDDAVHDAQQAYSRALVVRKERAERAARAPATGWARNCKGETQAVGPFHGRQHWDMDLDADPPRATTWSWVGFIGLCDCSPDLDA
ncbi:MAG: hypothetical protein ACK5YQ_04350 [Betaproteobacteria bacterium]|jgi:hypothetical protein